MESFTDSNQELRKMLMSQVEDVRRRMIEQMQLIRSMKKFWHSEAEQVVEKIVAGENSQALEYLEKISYSVKDTKDDRMNIYADSSKRALRGDLIR